MASATRGTLSVEVSAMGDSISPNSFTCVEPASLPKALPTKTAPGTFSRNRLPPCGRIAVTPVRMLSPRIMVVWPTSTPATSVMAFSAPGGSTPTVIPRSRARGRGWSGRWPWPWPSSAALLRSRRITAGRDWATFAAILLFCVRSIEDQFPADKGFHDSDREDLFRSRFELGDVLVDHDQVRE